MSGFTIRIPTFQPSLSRSECSSSLASKRISCIILLAGVLLFCGLMFSGGKASSPTSLLKSSIHAKMSKMHPGGVWQHGAFIPKQVWFLDSGSIHSPATQAALVAEKMARLANQFVVSEKKLSHPANAYSSKSSLSDKIHFKIGTEPHSSVPMERKTHLKYQKEMVSESHQPIQFATSEASATTKNNDEDHPFSFDDKSPAALAAAAAAIAQAASEVADKAQNSPEKPSHIIQHKNTHYLFPTPAASDRELSRPAIHENPVKYSIEAAASEHGTFLTTDEFSEIENRLKSLETEVSDLKAKVAEERQTTVPTDVPTDVDAGAGAESSPEPLVAQATSSPVEETNGILNHLKAVYQQRGSQNPEADAAIEKVLKDLAARRMVDKWN